MEDAVNTVAWDVFARIRVELMAMGEEEALIKEANEMANYTNQECEFDK